MSDRRERNKKTLQGIGIVTENITDAAAKAGKTAALVAMEASPEIEAAATALGSPAAQELSETFVEGAEPAMREVTRVIMTKLDELRNLQAKAADIISASSEAGIALATSALAKRADVTSALAKRANRTSAAINPVAMTKAKLTQRMPSINNPLVPMRGGTRRHKKTPKKYRKKSHRKHTRRQRRQHMRRQRRQHTRDQRRQHTRRQRRQHTRGRRKQTSLHKRR